MEISIPTEVTDLAKITVFGVGGAGGNALVPILTHKLLTVPVLKTKSNWAHS